MIHIERLLNTQLGIFFISVLMGLGLATLFRKTCTDENCIVFNGPVISEIDGKTYQFGEMCYQYKLFPSKCEPIRKTIEMNDVTAKIVEKEQETSKPKSGFSFLPFS
jgi:hypothetical protein